MKKLIFIYVVVLSFLLVVLNYQDVGVVDDANNRNCVAIIDSKYVEAAPGILNKTIIEFAFRSVHEDSVRLVMYGSADTKKELISSMMTTPCKVTSISLASVDVASYNIRFREDIIYVINLGSNDPRILTKLKNYKILNGIYSFDSNIILVSGGDPGHSLSCNFMRSYVSAQCFLPQFEKNSKFVVGSIEYKDDIYFGNSIATSVFAGTILKMITSEKVL